MGALKRAKPHASARGHAAPGKRRRSPPDVAPGALPADSDDATRAAAPTFEIEAPERDTDLEGAVDDWAGIDSVADLVDEPTEGRRRR